MAKRGSSKKGEKRDAVAPAAVPAQPEVVGLEVGPVDEGVLIAHSDDGPGALLAAAEAAQEEYDYDRALNLLRLAALASEGGDDAVEGLARFLVESYGMYDEAVALLRSERVAVHRRPTLQRLLADALFSRGDSAEAGPLYEELAARPKTADAVIWERVAQYREDQGDDAGALAAAEAALKFAPGASSVLAIKERVGDRLAAAASERVDEARALADGGDVDGAMALLRELLDAPGDGRDAAALLRNLESQQRAGELSEMVARAEAAEQAFDFGEALDLWREVLALESGHEAASDAVPRLERALACAFFQDRLERGSSAVREGRLEDAIHAFYRALAVKPEGVEPPAEQEGLHLYELTRDYIDDHGAQKLERHAPALVAVCRAELAVARGAFEEADELVRDAGRALSSLKRLDALREQLTAAARERDRARAGEAFEEAEIYEELGELVEAAEMFERAAGLAGDDFRESRARADALRERLRRAEEEQRFRDQLQRLESEERWFELRRAIDASPLVGVEDLDYAEIRARALDAVAERYPAAIAPPPFVMPDQWGSELDSRSLGLPDVDRTETRVLRSPDGAFLLVLSGPMLVLVDADRLTARVVADLSPNVSFGMKGELVLATEHPKEGIRLALISEKEKHVLLVQVTAMGIAVEDKLDISALVPTQREGTLRYYGLHAPTERIIQLQTARKTNGPSTLRNLSLRDGRMVHEENYNYGLWNLVPFPGTDEFVVNRVADFALRFQRGYFTFARMDYRGRFLERFNLLPEDVPEPMEKIHSVARSRSLDRLYMTYDYYDALGNVVRHYPALMVLKGNGDVFYQSPAPEKLLSGKRLPKGTVRVIEPFDGDPMLIVPHADSEGAAGLSVLGAEDLKLRFDLPLQEGEQLHSLHETLGGTRLLAMTFPFGDGGWRIRRLDVEQNKWGCDCD